MVPSAETTSFLYHHVVLPPKLPQEDDSDPTHERSLCNMVLDALKYLMVITDKNYTDTVTYAVSMISNLRDGQDIYGDVSEVQLDSILSKLAAGTMDGAVPLEIKAQNAGILMTCDKKHLIFESFELSPTNDAAMCSTRLARTFPGSASRFPISKMRDTKLRESLVNTVAKMSTQSAPGFQPQARKNGKHEDEYRDTSAPGLVTELLWTIITAHGEPTDSKRIKKATREDVLWNACLHPWRRSPLWLLIRVSLQLWFTRSAIELQSPGSLYKAFMICMLSKLLDLAKSNWNELGTEAVHNISSKLIRRLRKFELLNQSQCLHPNWTLSIRESLENAHRITDQHWKSIIFNPQSRIDTALLKNVQPANDLDMKLPELDIFLSRARNRQHDRSVSTFKPSSLFPGIPAGVFPQNLYRSNDDKCLRLLAVEEWVDYHLQTWISSRLQDPTTCGKLRSLLENYFAVASATYTGIPVSTSIMYLTVSELWKACDEAACAQFPLLSQYDHELCITEFQCLTLPLRHHMERLHEVERYVEKRRAAARAHLPSLYRSFGMQSSFAVRYFDQSTELQSTLSEIERHAEEKRAQKYQELKNLQARYKDLMNQYNNKSCDSETYVYNHYHGYKATRHPSWCSRCLCKKRADALNIHIHEWPVSSNTSVAKATVFELKVPQAFSDWRDTSAFMITDVLGHCNHIAEKPSVSYTLDGHQDLSHMLSSSYGQRRIVPLSNVKPHNATHRNQKTAVHRLTEGDVCLKNALQYAYFDKSLGVITKGNSECTDTVPKVCMYHVPKRSKTLDRFMYRPPSAPDGTTANEVIASLSDCPDHLSIEEYKAFGSIPFGSRIIYSNVLTQLATSALDFAKPETQCLILQTIQQAGLPSGDIERTNHAIVTEKIFGHAMLQQLEIALGRLSENWESWRAAASFSLLARRLLNLTKSSEVHTRGLQYLIELRSASFKWLRKLKTRAALSTGDEQRDELYSRVTEIALLCASTYDVEDVDVDVVLRQESAVSMLLQSSIVIQENCDSVRSEHQILYKSMLQSHEAMMYRLFTKLQALILQDGAGLCDAVTANWAAFEQNSCADWYALEQPQQHWLSIKSGTLLVHFNLLTAELLVDGLPLARLPPEFMQHGMYRPLFSKSTIDVVPTDEPGLRFSARCTFHHYKIHFGMQTPDLLVVAIRGKTRLDLIPSRVFQSHLPHAFVTDCIHWYDHTNDEVVFRSRESPWTSGSDCWYMKRDNQTQCWRLVKGSNVLINLKSTSASVLSKIVQPLEEAHHIHIVLDTETQTVDASLPRLQLGFFVERGSDALYSRQFRGMAIDDQQNVGTLIGLTSKLLLRNSQSERMVLIPVPQKFGTPSIQYGKDSSSEHITVTISKDDATKVYAYTLDEVLGRVTESGDLESKLFISYLHALTSSCLPDPLTKLTGTEASLQILQSAAVQSFELLSERDIDLLVQIANLSTTRSFYPRHKRVMQQVSWNNNLIAQSQNPHFRTSVDQIFGHAARMQVFYPDQNIFNVLRDARQRICSDTFLDRRDRLRTVAFYGTTPNIEPITMLQDEEYIARDSQPKSARSERAIVAASLVLRDNFTMHEPVANLRNILQREHFCQNIVKGVDSAFAPSCLRYDAKWLQESSELFKSMWCSLYCCLTTSSNDIHVYDIMIWLSTMAYAESADMSVIQALAAAYRDSEFSTIDLPLAPMFELAAGVDWNQQEVHNIMQRNLVSFEHSEESRFSSQQRESEQQHVKRIKALFDSNQKAAVRSFMLELKQQWPIRWPSSPNSSTVHKYVHVESAMNTIRVNFEHWHDNRGFFQYLDQVSRTLANQAILWVIQPCHMTSAPIQQEGLIHYRRRLTSEELFAAVPPCLSPQFPSQNATTKLKMPFEPKFLAEIQVSPTDSSDLCDELESLCCNLQSYAGSRTEQDYVAQLRTSCAALNKQDVGSPSMATLPERLEALLRQYLRDCKSFFEDFNDALVQGVRDSTLFSDQIGLRTDHSIRLSPKFWLAQLHRDRFKSLSGDWKSIIIQYGLAITHLHRAMRLVALINTPIDLYEEIGHVGHSNWSPFQFPETLLLEAESGIMIRAEQELIASHMRSPASNVVLQFQMGSGKSSIIVPMLAAYLADKEKLVRIIVAKAQSHQMRQMLVSKLGGLLNRRIYQMPFSRNLRLTVTDAENIRKLLEDCVENRGVLLIQPEHILSFKLMGIESLLTDQPELARSMLATEQYLDNVTRDIIDEVDENLSVKFELIYTMGAQEPIDFAPGRWSIIHQILGLVPQFAFQVHKRLPEAMDIHDVGDGKFPRIRFLRKDAADETLELLAKHIVARGLPGLPTFSQSDGMRLAILRYITQPTLDLKDIEAVEKSKFWSDSTKQLLLLVRGLIAGGVLRFTLSNKRWRVNYGLDTACIPRTPLAVPYRSKDSPSPRSEFSHSDVVLILTLLSQYYGGLSDEQLFDTLTHVLNTDLCDVHYEDFVHTASSRLPAAFRQLSGISIRDRHQCITEVFPALRYSKNMVDYYLTRLVFPKQCKQFPHKLSVSGWDLGASKVHPTTGFSGTNDTLHLLPLEMKHLDLPSQSHTNAQVLAYLLGNDTSVELLPPFTSGAISDGEHLLTIIEGLKSDVRVVLDCGASILELNNRGVAETWLRMRGRDVEAVVYFEDERLSVLDRSGKIEDFQTSPYAKQLDSCIVYLDESHTRGTDLKLPRDYRAVVTLGAQVAKDKLTQACMRMRKLGHGQSVTFMVPEEIANTIRELTGKTIVDQITVKDVICWSITETWKDLKRSMPLWAVQGQRFESHRHLLNGADTSRDHAIEFLENEAQSLETRYRPRVQHDDEAFQALGWDLANRNIDQIVARCRDFEAMGFGSAALSEEQERELAPEIEEERQVERPPKMKAETHLLHPDLLQLACSGYMEESSTTFDPAFNALRYTSAAKLFDLTQSPSFPTDLLVTADFMRTVKIPPGLSRETFISDSYQRPVQFIVTGAKANQAIIISPFEANELIPMITKKKKITLHLFAPRSNGGFAPLDHLTLYTIGRDFKPNSISRSLTIQLNLFAGSLYLRSLAEYNELCEFLGLLWTLSAKPGQQICADGFIDPPAGKWGLKQSPISFLRALSTKIRRDGEGVEKTHLGKLLNGIRLEEEDFKGLCD